MEEVHAIALLPTQEQPSQQAAPCNKGKGKAKVMEEDEDKEGEAAQKLRKELEDFMVLTKFDNKLLASLLPPPMEFYKRDVRHWNAEETSLLEALTIAKCVKLVQAAKAFLKQQEGFKGKGKAKALVVDSESTGAKRALKSTESVDSNSDEEEEEERPIGTRKGKEIIELEDLEEETVVPKTPMAGHSCQTLKPVVLVPSMPKAIPKPIVALASPVAGPSTA
ncbi:hypothetical protein C0995_012566 [Termitomyces sp. Mi166|nr:hypothetical protein C0995_012566 [Termitomyces sp. Mi166\